VTSGIPAGEHPSGSSMERDRLDASGIGVDAMVEPGVVDQSMVMPA
jgi:hypothetical protein